MGDNPGSHQGEIIKPPQGGFSYSGRRVGPFVF